MWIDDDVMRRCAEPLAAAVWMPQDTFVVLGNSNDETLEVEKAACEADGVKVLKRYGGGGAVVLYPGSLVLSFGCWVESAFENGKYFKALNDALLKSLRDSVDRMP